MLEQADTAAVKVGLRNYVVARLEKLKKERYRSHPRGQRKRVGSVLESRHDLLEMRPRGVLQSAVVIARAPADSGMRVRRGLVDWEA